MKLPSIIAIAALVAGPAFSAPEKYVFDASHSQIVFSYNHLGYSTTWGMFSGFDGEILFDEDEPANSSVSVSFPESMMYTGWEARLRHFMSPDFLGASDDDTVSFVSTDIRVTGESTGTITGTLTLNGVSREISLDTRMNQKNIHPRAGKPWMGFDASTTLNRSDFDLGAFTPFISDEVEVRISIEAMLAG